MPEDQRSFWEHLDELRTVLLKSLAAWLAASVGAFCLKDRLFDLLFAPACPDFVLYRALCRLGETTGWGALCPEGMPVEFLNTELTAQFMTHLEVALFAGLAVALPLILFWLYGFVAPGLYQRERRTGVWLLVVSVLLFAAGAAVSYFLIFPVSFRFLSGYQVSDLVVNRISLSSYMSVLLVLTLLMGLLFEVPVLTWLLSRLGVLSPERLRRGRRYVFTVLLIVAAVITPTGDPFTLLLVTLPVYLLYELSIHVVKAGK